MPMDAYYSTERRGASVGYVLKDATGTVLTSGSAPAVVVSKNPAA
jgi:hypothetical protein